MKTVLLILGVLLVLIGGIAALLFWAHSSGSDRQEKFFEAVLSGDTTRFIAMLHPDARDEIDEPVLAEWMKTFSENLGELKGLSAAGFSTKVELTDAGKVVKTEGTVKFTKGSAKSQLTFLDDQIMQFTVKSDKMPAGWFKGPADTTLYRQRGEKLFRHLTAGEAAQARAMFHENFQKKYSLTDVEEFAADITTQFGALKSITFVSDDYEGAPGGQFLETVFRFTFEKGQTEGSVRFQFLGLKGYPIRFRIKPVESSHRER